MLGWLMEIILLIQLVPPQEILLKVRYLKELLVTTLGQNLAMVERLNCKFYLKSFYLITISAYSRYDFNPVQQRGDLVKSNEVNC